MSEERDDRVLLPKAAEALLADWPLSERTPDWKRLADKTVADALARGRSSADAALLEPPLPRLTDEPEDPPTLGAPDASLHSAVSEDDAPEDTPVSAVETVRSHGAPAAASSERPQAKVVELPSSPPRLSATDIAARRSVPILIAGALAAAAAMIVLVRSQGEAVPPIAVTAEQATPAPAPTREPREEPAPPASPPTEEQAPAEELASPPPAEAVKQPATKTRSRASDQAPKRTARSVSGNNALRSPAKSTPKSAAPGAAQAGPSHPDMKPADQPLNVPQRPSTGAVQGAIASVMPSAQTCLAGQQQSSTANVTWGSDGRVRSVQVTGPAAGTPAEACIRQKLSGARVPRFAEPSFSANIPVRP